MGPKLLRLFYRLVPQTYYSWPLNLLHGDGTILDVGAGPGILASHLEKRYDYVIALDVDLALLQRWRPQRGDRVAASACLPPLRRESIDAAVLHDSLHHLPEPEKGLRETCSLLKPGGRLAIFDFDLEQPPTKAVAIAEKLLGFPARFYRLGELLKLAATCIDVSTVQRGPLGAVAVIGVKRRDA